MSVQEGQEPEVQGTANQTEVYSITGLQCGGCVANVTQAVKETYPNIRLSVSHNLKQLTVSYSSEELDHLDGVVALIESLGDYHVTHLTEIYLAVGPPTVVSGSEGTQVRQSAKRKTVFCPKLSTFTPLFLILAYMTGSVTVYGLREGIDWMRGMEVFMGLFYLIFSFFKLLNLGGFVRQFQKYDPISLVLPIYAYFYPLLEILLGTTYMWGAYITEANAVTLGLFSMNLVGVGVALHQGKQLECACLGSILRLPLSVVTLVEDTAMIIMSILGLWLG